MLKNNVSRPVRVLAVFILLGSVLFFMPRACASTVEELEDTFVQANDHYEKGEYIKAVEEYHKILSSGYTSGKLYYNLGNASFRAGMLGQAILNYERARRFIPRDADLAANYRFAELLVKGNPPAEKGIWAWRPLKLYYNRFTADELSMIASVLYVLTVAGLMIMIYFPRWTRYLLIPALLMAFLSTGNAVSAWHAVSGIGRESVVVVPETECKFGPFDAGTKFFTLYEGMTVTVIQTKDDWRKIRRLDGKTGWVKKDALEVI
ncbi:MAG: SH3 domain-containing protein [Candidatus Omnitrophica bacterium]|nr:SH3 domain-containing protein [Candidatus Omnitrophota bacterium]